MSILKIVTILNWIIIAFVGFIAVSEAFSPYRGDAATQGLKPLPIIVLVVLLVLNLLPFDWTKYVALVLVALPVLLFKIWPIWQERQRIARDEARYKMEDAAPIFEDQQRDQIARAIRDGDVEKLKELLKTPVERFNEKGHLLDFAIDVASGANYRPAEKIECVRLLFAAGAKLDSTKGGIPSHIVVATNGNVELLRFLLEQGADPNAFQNQFGCSILFEAIRSYEDPEASVRALLEFGADPNATAVLNQEEGPVSPLWKAAKMERWGVCAALLEHGADPEFESAQGTSFRTLAQEGEQEMAETGYSTKPDYERMKKVLAQAGKGRMKDKR